MSISNNMIDTGAWYVDKQPKINYSEYNSHLKFGFQYKSFKFICEILTLKSGADDFIFFIKPYYKEFNNNFLVFTDQIKPTIYRQRDIYNFNFPNDKLKELLSDFRESKIFYSDDITGTDFKQCIDFSIKK